MRTRRGIRRLLRGSFRSGRQDEASERSWLARDFERGRNDACMVGARELRKARSAMVVRECLP